MIAQGFTKKHIKGEKEMYINEKNAEAVVEALVEQVRALKSELWWKESKITELKGEIEKLKGGE